MKDEIKEFVGYVIASAVSLLVDYIVYFAIVNKHIFSLSVSADIGYLSGLVVAYYLLSGKVFKGGWMRNKKIQEVGLFAVSGIFGMLITYITVTVYVNLIGHQIIGAKNAAVIVSFISVYIFRKKIVFKVEEAS